MHIALKVNIVHTALNHSGAKGRSCMYFASVTGTMREKPQQYLFRLSYSVSLVTILFLSKNKTKQ